MLGFPVLDTGQEQKAWWFETEHSAHSPQTELEQGLLHCDSMQDSLDGHWESEVQPGVQKRSLQM